jgi:hypothetical protein
MAEGEREYGGGGLEPPPFTVIGGQLEEHIGCLRKKL